MNTVDVKRVPRWISIPLSLFVLAVCLFYTYAVVYLAPYPGFRWRSSNGEVVSIDPCHARQTLCEANQGPLQVGDRILAVDGVEFEKLSNSSPEMPFGEYRPGDSMSIRILREGQEQTIDWLVVGPSTIVQANRLFYPLLISIPFWLNGTLILFFLGPRSCSRLVCLLMASFNYATAIWLTTGAHAGMQVMYNRLVEHTLSWFLVPIYLHFHLVVPGSLIRRNWRYILGPLYAIAAVLSLLELFQVLPASAFYLAMLLGFLSSLGVLVFRFIFNPRPMDRRGVILMLVGITVSLGPGIVLSVIPSLLQIPLSTELTAIAPGLAIPLLPFFYVYAIFKRYLGSFEARFRRWLGLYSFLLLYATVIVAVFYLGSYLVSPMGKWGAFVVVMWTLFGVATVPLYRLSQRILGRLAYGVTYDMSDMLHTFSTKVRAIVGSEEWMRVLADELDSRLLIRQSALCLFTDDGPRSVYAHGINADEMLQACQNVQSLLADAGRYRLVAENSEGEFDWVRLTILLRIGGKTIGIWLFGRRDPDSYYSEEDIKLLTTLAGQAAVVVENDRLYDRALQEIAERTRVEEALLESEERLRAVLDATIESVILMDDQGVILALNQTAARRLGVEVDDIIGRRRSALVAQRKLSVGLLDSRMREINQVLRSGKPVQFEDERDGLIYDASVYPILDAEGQVRRVAIFARDVTARRQAEQRAVQIERLAAMGQIAGALAHEINNPLQAVRSNLEMLVDFDLSSDESGGRFGSALEEIQHLARVTRGVVEFTQAAQEDLRQVSATRLLRRALALADERLELANIQVGATFPDQPVLIYAAPSQIVQALFNLIANVVEGMPIGGHLDVAVRATGDMVALSLFGKGYRLMPGQIEHLFDPFFADEGGDAGLGLWISRGIVERHCGTISVQSLEGGQGVAFEVALPLRSGSE